MGDVLYSYRKLLFHTSIWSFQALLLATYLSLSQVAQLLILSRLGLLRRLNIERLIFIFNGGLTYSSPIYP